MPTYEYKCSACGEKFEKFQSITSAPIRKCPHCGKNSAKRLIGTGSGLIFKGSGFYITDYRSEGYKEKAKAESGGGETKKTDGAPASDAKPAEKKDSSGRKEPTPAASTAEAKAAEKAPSKSASKSSDNKPSDKKSR